MHPAYSLADLLMMSHFFKLPREVRDEIYDLCLVISYDIILEPAGWEKAAMERANCFQRQGPEVNDPDGFGPRNRPTVALLRVSKSLHLEASLVFYGRNRFRLPLYPNSRQDSVFKKYSAQFHHITVCFDLRDVPDREHFIIWVKARYFIEDEKNKSLFTDKERFYKQYIKSEMTSTLFGIWARKKKTRFPMKNLRTIVVDLGFLDGARGQHISRWSDWDLLKHDSFFRDVMSYWDHPIGYDAHSALPGVSVRLPRVAWVEKLVVGKWAFSASGEDLGERL